MKLVILVQVQNARHFTGGQIVEDITNKLTARMPDFAVAYFRAVDVKPYPAPILGFPLVFPTVAVAPNRTLYVPSSGINNRAVSYRVACGCGETAKVDVSLPS